MAFFLAVSALVLAGPAQADPADYWTGHATVPATVIGNVYSIQNASELAWIAEQVNSGADLSGAVIELGQNIDLSGYYWVPIGDAAHHFFGRFNGNGWEISNMTIGSPGTPETSLDYAGLFGYVVNSTIRDVIIQDTEMYLSPVSYAGCLAGKVAGATITGCHTQGVTGVSDGYLGGLIGSMSGCNISDCSAEVDVSGGGSSYIGGLIGYNELSQILDGHAGGDVTGGDNSSIGGLIGWNNSGNVSGSYAEGDVEGGDGSDTGGLIGRNNSGLISESYADGAVTGGAGPLSYIGGLIGDNDADSIVSESYAKGITTGGDGSYSGGLIGNNAGEVNQSHAEGDVTGGAGADAYTGGLIGSSSGEVYESYAQGKVTGGDFSSAGGLIGYISGVNSYVNNSYARGDVEGGDGSNAGGIAGYNHYSLTANCYSTGGVTGGTGALVGGFAGKEEGDVSHYISYGYWNSDANLTGIGGTAIPLAAERAPAKTSVQMKSQEFGDLLEANKQGIFSVWSIVAGSNDGYPVLIPADLVWVTFDENGGDTGANPGQKAIVRGNRAGSLPVSPTCPGKTFTGWNKAGDGSGDQFTEDTIVNADITVYAQWLTPHSHHSGGGTRAASPTYTAVFTGTDANETTLAVKVNAEAGSATVDLGSVAGSIFNGQGSAVLNVPAIPGVKAYTMEIPASTLSGSRGEGTLTFSTEMGSIAIPGNMFSGFNGEKAGITIGQGDKTGLTDQVKAAIGDRPLVQLTLMVDGERTEWNNPDAPVTVSIPYTPIAEEQADPDHIVVWYIDGSSSPVPVPSGRYGPVTGAVTFICTHFSHYAVAYVHKTFVDLGGAEWAREQIEALTSKGILKGTSEKEFAPQSNITRADFLYFLFRTLGVNARFDGNFDDISSDAYYYKEIAIAKKLGISGGIGDNKFNPDAGITRQDMMVLTERALRLLGKVEQQGTVSDLDKFADKSLIASYALNSVASLVKEGLIAGSGGQVDPMGNTTRAEASVLLYRIYNRRGEFQTWARQE